MCVDGTKFAGAPKTRSGRSRAVISVGRFVHKKNFETLLAAWSPEFGQLLIVGGFWAAPPADRWEAFIRMVLLGLFYTPLMLLAARQLDLWERPLWLLRRYFRGE